MAKKNAKKRKNPTKNNNNVNHRIPQQGPITVKYWKDVIQNPKLSLDDDIQVQNVLKKLLNGSLDSADLKVHRGTKNEKLYCVRLNQERRMFFTTKIENGIPKLLVLEIIENHDYQKSKFRKSGVLQHFLEKHGDNLPSFTVEDFVDVAELPFPPKGGNEEELELEFEPVHFFKKEFITFSDEQNETLSIQLPAIVAGPPGSGKSCSAVARMHECDLYVAQSPTLVQEMRDIWESLPEREEGAKKRAQFKSWLDLYQEAIDAINENLPEEQRIKLSEETFVDEAFIEKWLNRYIHAWNKMAPNILPEALSSSFFAKRPLFYEEFRTISGYSREDYLNLGSKESLFLEKEQREWLYDAFVDYKKEVAHHKKVDLSFVEFKLPSYPKIVLDEGQDMSGWQMRKLFKACDGKILVCMDTRQSIKDSLSKRAYWNYLSYQKFGKPIESTTLSGTWRSSEAIVEVLNTILTLRNQTTGGAADKEETAQIVLTEQQRHPGEVYWFDNLNDLVKMVTPWIESDRIAIIVPSGDKTAAQDAFPSAVYVLTPEEAKGHEYDRAVIFGPFNDPNYKEINRILATSEPKKSHGNRAKKGQNNKQDLRTIFNSLIISCSRAVQDMYFYQGKTSYDIKHLENPIKSKTKKFNAKAISIPSSVSREALIEQHLAEYKIFLQQKNYPIARKILARYGEEAIFKSFIQQNPEKNLPPAEAPKGNGNNKAQRIFPEVKGTFFSPINIKQPQDLISNIKKKTAAWCHLGFESDNNEVSKLKKTYNDALKKALYDKFYSVEMAQKFGVDWKDYLLDFSSKVLALLGTGGNFELSATAFGVFEAEYPKENCILNVYEDGDELIGFFQQGNEIFSLWPSEKSKQFLLTLAEKEIKPSYIYTSSANSVKEWQKDLAEALQDEIAAWFQNPNDFPCYTHLEEIGLTFRHLYLKYLEAIHGQTEKVNQVFRPGLILRDFIYLIHFLSKIGPFPYPFKFSGDDIFNTLVRYSNFNFAEFIMTRAYYKLHPEKIGTMMMYKDYHTPFKANPKAILPNLHQPAFIKISLAQLQGISLIVAEGLQSLEKFQTRSDLRKMAAVEVYRKYLAENPKALNFRGYILAALADISGVYSGEFGAAALFMKIVKTLPSHFIKYTNAVSYEYNGEKRSFLVVSNYYYTINSNLSFQVMDDINFSSEVPWDAVNYQTLVKGEDIKPNLADMMMQGFRSKLEGLFLEYLAEQTLSLAESELSDTLGFLNA